MRTYRGARSERAVRALLTAILAVTASGGAFAQTQTPLVYTSHTVVTQDEPPAIEHDFTIANAGTYTVTVTDLGSKQTPSAPLTSVAMAVTQGTTLAGTPTSVAAAGTPITLTAQAGASYTVHVIGIPGSTPGSGPIEEDVTDSNGNKVDSWVDTLSVPPQQSSAPSSFGVLTDTFTVNSSGTYTVSMTDLKFPLALSSTADTAGLVIVDATSGTLVTALTGPGSPGTAQLNQGDSYRIVAFGEAQAGTPAGGLFSVEVAPATGSPVYGPMLVPVGAVTLIQTSASGKPQSSFTLPAATASTLGLTDLTFPEVPLVSLGAALVDVSAQQSLATVTSTGQQNFTTGNASDSYEVFAYALADNTSDSGGSYSVVVQQGTAFPFSEAEAVSSTGTAGTVDAFNFDVSAASTASYVFTLKDFGYPAQIGLCGLAAVQDGQRRGSVTSGGNFTASVNQGPVTLLAFGEEGSTSSQSLCAGGSPSSAATAQPGLMDIDMSPAGGGTSLFNTTEAIGAGFSSTPFNVTSSEKVQVNVADLGFPASLQTLSIAVTDGTNMAGSITASNSSGPLTFQAAANTTYDVNVIAVPATSSSGTSQSEQAGTYAVSAYPTPTATLSASSTSVTSGGTVTLTWSSQNATSCTASASPSNSAWSGSESPTGGTVTSAAITADITFSLSCTGGGGTISQSAAVSISAASSGGHGGGGAIDPELLLALAALLTLRICAARRRPAVRQP